MFIKFFGLILQFFSSDIGIDLGTANTLIYIKGKGIVINEPTIVAINKKTGQIIAVGAEAKAMQGRTPLHIEVVRPLVDGVISDFEVTEEMLSYLINRVRSETKMIIAPKVVVGVPSGITNVEMRAVCDATRNAGAREVFLIEEPIAAAIGAKLPINQASGNMIIDIGGGTTNIAVISLNGLVVAKNLKVAGDHLNQAIVSYIRDQFKIYIGDKTAEETKIVLATIITGKDDKEHIIRGRDVITGLPREVIITASDIKDAIISHIDNIVESVQKVLELTPPEITADIMQKGIYLSGGGALIPGLQQLLEDSLSVPVIVVPDPLRAVIRGTGIIIENFSLYEEVFMDKESELSPELF